MKIKKIKIPIYDWDVLVLIIESKEDSIQYEKEVKKFGFKDPDDYGMDLELISQDIYNGGACTYDTNASRQIITVYQCSNKHELLKTILHECDHAVWNILERAHVNDKEARAYLSGFLGSEILKDIII